MYVTTDSEDVVSLDSEVLFFQSLVLPEIQKRSDIKIPETIICENGQWKQWLFNSERERNHVILRKKKENMTSFNIARHFAWAAGFHQALKKCATVQDILEQLTGKTRNQSSASNSNAAAHEAQLSPALHHSANNNNDNNLHQSCLSVVYKGSRTLQTIRLVDFVKTLTSKSYSGGNCPEGWRLVQQQVANNSRHSEVYYCLAQKPSDILSYRHTFLKRTVPEDNQDHHHPFDEQRIFTNGETKEVSKVYDQNVTHRLLTNTSKVLDLLQTSTKCTPRKLIVKYSLNKLREPILVGIVSATIKIPRKFIESKEIKAGDTIDFLSYIKLHQKLRLLPELQSEPSRFLEKRLANHSPPTNNNNLKTTASNRFITSQNSIELCQGDLCNLLLRSDAQKKLVQGSMREVSKEIVDKIRKAANTKKILTRLKDANIIVTDSEAAVKKGGPLDTATNQQDDLVVATMLKAIVTKKVCKKCYFLYGVVSKTMEFDSAGNLIDLRLTRANKNLGSQVYANYPNEEKQSTIRLKKLIDAAGEASAKQSKFQSIKLSASNLRATGFNKSGQPDTLPLLQQTTRSVSKQKQSSSLSNSRVEKRPASSNQEKAQPNTSSESKLSLSKSKLPVEVNPRSRVQLRSLKQMKAISLMTSLPRIRAKSKLQKQGKKQSQAAFKPTGPALSKPDQTQPIRLIENQNNSRQPALRDIYAMEKTNGSSLESDSKQYSAPQPRIELSKLCTLSKCPELVLKNDFLVQTLICDERTAITYCLLTSKMFGGEMQHGVAASNLIVVHDLFDCFLDHLAGVKDFLQSSANRRVLLFNYPGQAYTIYNSSASIESSKGFVGQMAEILDKLFYDLDRGEGLINLRTDRNYLLGLGYGTHIIQYYLNQNASWFQPRKILLVNPYPKQLPSALRSAFQRLYDKYSSNKAKTAEEDPFRAWYSLIKSSLTTNPQAIQFKKTLNPINLSGRLFLLRNILNDQQSSSPSNSESETVLPTPTQLVRGDKNLFITQADCNNLLLDKKQQKIKGAQLINVRGGYDVFSDSPTEINRLIQTFFLK